MNYLQKELNELIQSDTHIFEFLQNSALDGLWYWDLENPEHEWMNEKFWTTLGYDPKDMPHTPDAWQEIINAEDLILAKEKLGLHMRDASHKYDQIVRYKHADGHTVWIRCRGMAIRTEDGNPIRMLGAHTDISEQKVSEIRLQKRLQEFDQVIKGTQLATWQWNIDEGHVKFNDLLIAWLGYEKDSAPVENLDFWKEKIHKDDYRIAKTRLIEHFKADNDFFECEMRIEDSVGGWVWVVCKGKILKRSESGRVIAMSGFCQNVTKRKEVEISLKHYQELLNRSNEVARIGSWEVNLLKGTIEWSKVTKEIHEVPDSYVPDLDEGIKFYKEGESRNRLNKLFFGSIEKGVSFDDEFEIVTNKGNIKWVRSIGFPVKEGGEVVSIYGVFHDITELKESQLETERLLRVKEEKNERLTNFSNIVSHNLRSHSVNLRLLVGMIAERFPNIENSEVYTMLELSTKNLEDTIEHLNEVASLSLLTQEELVNRSLEPFISKAVAAVKPSLVECNASVELSGSLDSKAMLIPAYMDSILLNLLTNAIRYQSHKRDLRIKINVQEKDGTVVLSVKDNGLGIDMKKYGHKIFGMYKVFHDHKDSRGIGLFISKGQIEAMNGDISVESKVDVGTTFYLKLKK